MIYYEKKARFQDFVKYFVISPWQRHIAILGFNSRISARWSKRYRFYTFIYYGLFLL